jgi:hypothetical protein
MAVGQKFFPTGMNLDLHEGRITPVLSTFIKGLHAEVSTNPNLKGSEGGNVGVLKKHESNFSKLDFVMPEGVNRACGVREFKKTREVYVWVWNSNNNHLIYRIIGGGKSEIVYQHPDLDFQLRPANFIMGRRAALVTRSVFDPVTGNLVEKKFLVFTDKHTWVRCICVEDSIATNSFTGQFFTSRYDHVLLTTLGVPENNDGIGIEEIPVNELDPPRQNRLRYSLWQFRVKSIDVYGRPADHGIMSDTYYPALSQCVQSNKAASCLSLTFDAGTPLVDKWVIEYRNCGGNWVQHEVLNKYNNCDVKNWWERTKNGSINFIPDTNLVKYTFCADKECIPISPDETIRNYNPIPRISGVVEPVGEALVLADNEDGFEPVDCKELNKIEWKVTPPEKSSCGPLVREVTVYAMLYTLGNGSGPQALRKFEDNIIWGADENNSNIVAWAKQYLSPGQEGFIGYMTGTSIAAISKQCRYDKRTGEIVETGIDWLKGVPELPLVAGLFYVPLQKWTFRVSAGTYVFRVAGHQTTLQDDYKRTSTYVYGQTVLANPGQMLSLGKYEVVIDATGGNVEVKDNPLLIADLTRSGGNFANGHSGYVYEDEVNKKPIEGAMLECFGNCAEIRHSPTTDHNGFYWGTRKNRGYFKIYGTRECKNGTTIVQTMETNDSGEGHYRFETLFVFKGNQEYSKADRQLFEGQLTTCEGLPVAGVGITMRNGPETITDANGKFLIIAHNLGNNFDVFKPRSEDIIITPNKCFFTSCEEQCSYKITPLTAVFTRCNNPNTTNEIGIRKVKLKKVSSGLQNGGRYPVVAILHEDLGHSTFGQATEKYYLDIPSIQETGVFDFSTVGYNISPTFQVGSKFKRLTFAIGQNLNFDSFLTWYCERVEFIDDAERKNTVNPSKIKLWVQSLTEYNAKNNFSVNASWQFVDEKGNPVLQDEIEIIANGDGKIFPKLLGGLVRYQKEGRFIVIDYDDSLKDLKDGCIIKFKQPRTCQNKEFFFETGKSIELKDGKVADANDLVGVLNAFDAYFVYRQIPVPFFNTDGTQDDTKTTLATVPFPFEHHSPSDFWGDKCGNRGRFYVKNPYESINIKRTEFAVSGALSKNGKLNYLGYFDETQKFSFDEIGWGAIVGVVCEVSTVLVICEHASFVVGFNDNELRVTEDGKIALPSAQKKFGNPQKKIGNSFGCAMEDIATIILEKGIVSFLSKQEKSMIFHNFNEAKDISKDQCVGWLNKKIDAHATNGKYFHCGYDPNLGWLLLSEASLEENSYVNNLRELSIEDNETIAFDMATGELRGFVHFTPELLCSLGNDQLYSLKDGAPWSHYNNGVNGFLNYYGQQTDPIAEIVYVQDEFKKKRFLSNEVYCKQHMFFVDRVKTETGQESRILKTHWDQAEYFHSASFKCDLNTIPDKNLPNETGKNKLLDGDLLNGAWVKARYVGDPDKANVYCEVMGITIFASASEKSST